jgi:hypothetical protein
VTRTSLLLLAAAAVVTCLVGVPVLIAGADDAPAKSSHRARAAGDDENDAHGTRGGWAWLKALALAADTSSRPVDVEDDDAHLGPALASLDRAIDDGIARCAPEILNYDRGILTKLQPDWHILKPNLRPSWRAWRAETGVVVDEKKIADCSDAFTKGTDCAQLAAMWQGCTTPFRGTLGEGEACTAHEQCVSNDCAYGTCTRPNDCEKNADCPEGMLCASTDTGVSFLTCVDAPKQGEDCVTGVGDEAHPDDVNNCGAGMACDVDGKCFPARREGSRCGSGQPCASPLYCGTDDDGDSVCMKNEPIPEEIIDGNNADAAAVADDSCACDPLRDGKACVDGRCVPAQIVEKSEACDASHLCRGSMGVTACIEGYCKDALGVGDACGDHDQCKDDLVCHGGACAEPARPGESCTSSDDCIFGLECLDSEDGTTYTCGLARAAEQGEAPPPPHLGLHGGPVIPLDDVVIDGVPPQDPSTPDGAPNVDDAPIPDDPRTGDDTTTPDDAQRLLDELQSSPDVSKRKIIIFE